MAVVLLAVQAAWKKLGMRLNGMQRRAIELKDVGATVYCWVPSDLQQASTQKPALLLLHGFGTEGLTAWSAHVKSLSQHFSLYIPDLLFFGDSFTTGDQRSELFQAACMHQALLSLGVSSAFVAGHSYGGFVAYRLAHLFPSFVSKLIMISSGVMMDPHSNDAVLLKCGATSIHEVLVPNSPAAFRRSLEVAFNKPVTFPDSIVKALLKFPYRDQRKQLIDGIVLGKEGAPQLPKISQRTLILWGDEDQIFNIKLANDLQKYIGENAKLVTFKGAGHVPQTTKGFDLEMISFLIDDNCDKSN